MRGHCRALLSLLGAAMFFPAMAVAAPSYSLVAVPSSQSVYEGGTSSLVDIYLQGDSNLNSNGVFLSYVSLTVTAGTGTIAAVNANTSDFDNDPGIPTPVTTNTGTFAEISEFSLAPFASGPNGVLLGSFDVAMPAGGTATHVSIDADNANAPIVIYSDAQGDQAAITALSGGADFTPEVPSPASFPMAAFGAAALLMLGRIRCRGMSF